MSYMELHQKQLYNFTLHKKQNWLIPYLNILIPKFPFFKIVARYRLSTGNICKQISRCFLPLSQSHHGETAPLDLRIINKVKSTTGSLCSTPPPAIPRPGDSPRRRTRRRESNIFRRGNDTLGMSRLQSCKIVSTKSESTCSFFSVWKGKNPTPPATLFNATTLEFKENWPYPPATFFNATTLEFNFIVVWKALG